MTTIERIRLMPPVGYSGARIGYRKVAVSFPEALFTKIVDRAIKEKKSFSETVTELCTVGDLDLTESDALEPKND